VLIFSRSKFYYTASGIIITVCDRPVHRLREDCRKREDTGSCNRKKYIALSGELDLKEAMDLS